MTEPTGASEKMSPLDAPPRSGVKRRVFGVLLLAVALAFLAWQIRAAGPAAIAASLAEASLPWIGVVILLTGLRYIVAAWRLATLTRRIFDTTRRLPFLRFVFVSQLLGIAIPGLKAGATVLRSHMANQRFGGGLALHMGPNLLDQLVLALSWVVVGAALLPVLALGGGPLPSGAALTLSATCAAALVLLIAVKRGRHRLVAWLERPRPGRRGRVAQASATSIEALGDLIDDPKALFVGLSGGITFVLLTGWAQHAALLAVGEPVHWWIAVLATIVGTTLGTASGTPGGLGVTEFAQVAFLEGHGVPVETATAAVLIARGAYFALILAGGSFALCWEISHGRLRELIGGRSNPST